MTWTAPEIARTRAATTTTERDALDQWLRFHRETLLMKCAGLNADELKTASTGPSTLTLLGLVRHMAENERWWFRRRFAGIDIDDLYCSTEFPDGDFDLIADADADADFAAFRAECDLADAATVGRSLDDVFLSRRGQEMNLRWAYIHMIEEYARHNGHADMLRERIDGVTGE